MIVLDPFISWFEDIYLFFKFYKKGVPILNFINFIKETNEQIYILRQFILFFISFYLISSVCYWLGYLVLPQPSFETVSVKFKAILQL
jgi:hypothetical protein